MSARFGFVGHPKPKAANISAADQAPPAAPSPMVSAHVEPAFTAPTAYVNEKLALHRLIIDNFNLDLLEKMSREELARQVSGYVTEFIKAERIPLNHREAKAFIEEIIDEMVGLGPIEPLLKDPSVSDILINGHESVYVERHGQLEPAMVRFEDESHLLRIISKIVSAVGRRVDEASPMVDARLADGSRVNVAVRPIAVDGPLMSIRKFPKYTFTMDRLVEVGTICPEIVELLKVAVQHRVSIIVSGGTGSGKTTMLNALSGFISVKERLILIEDASELQMQQPHVVRMETRPPNIEGKGEIRQRELLKNALRMRPNRIIIGECRGDEAFDMLQAMNTGHEGSMTSIHANSPRDAITRLEQMVGMATQAMSLQSIRQQIASAIQIVVQLQRFSDGTRRLTSLTEITSIEGDVIQTQEIFQFQKESTDDQGKIAGCFRTTGIRPVFLQHLNANTADLPMAHFERPLKL